MVVVNFRCTDPGEAAFCGEKIRNWQPHLCGGDAAQSCRDPARPTRHVSIQCRELTIEEWIGSLCPFLGQQREVTYWIFYLLGQGPGPTATPKRGKGTKDELAFAGQQWGPVMGPQIASVSSILPWPLPSSWPSWMNWVLSNQLNSCAWNARQN